MKIFVPGRICLFGEHTDWAGGYRRLNAEIEKGYTLIVGTNQGIFAEVKPHPNKLILTTTLNDGTRKEPFEIPMNTESLLDEAVKGCFFSYAAGVAYQIMTHYRVHGLEIDNYLTNIPIKKGLSSSAAICVLVARAFNRVYDLKMTIRGEMEYAYQGEITTPSRCGRMDQGCAYGNRPIMMIYDGDRIDVKELSVPHDLFYVIVDMGAEKDTKEILSRLNQCYPFAENEIQNNVQKYLGPISAQITQDAFNTLQNGDAEKLGALMKKAQADFDKHLQPACSSQLTAPVLHKVLNYDPIQPHIFGGKGVGSQGDGSAQFIAKDEKSQQKVIEIIERDLKMSCMKLTIQTNRRIRKAVIPAAGFGTRLFPATKAIKKELFPIIDCEGRAKPVILAIIEEALSAGIEEIGIIVQSNDREIFEDFLHTPPRIENFNKLSRTDQKYCEYLLEIGHKIHFINQDIQEGFGHAVFCAKEWVGNEPFLLLLGDHLYESKNDISCVQQLIDVYEQFNKSVVGLEISPAEEIHNFGCVTGEWHEKDSILSVTEIIEKPEIEYAHEHLQVEGMEENNYLKLFGLYILKPLIFEYLEEHITHNIREKGEFQLTSCIDRLRQEDGLTGYLVDGRCYDIGYPESYLNTLFNFKNRENRYNLESIGILAGGIAHDFNNILAAILGNISLAKISIDDKNEVIELLTEAEKVSLHAKDLTQQLLTFSKGSSPIKETTELIELIKDSARFTLRGSNVRYSSSIALDLWAADIDKRQIKQVLGSLIINAQQAMPEGGTINITAENVTVTTEDNLPLQEGKYIKISIIDKGTGILDEHLSNIFDPYFTTKQKGSGFGLTTAYSIIKRHDGHITVESELGVGTTFHIYLSASSKQIEKIVEIKKEPAIIKGKILLMDDEQDIRMIVSKTLTRSGSVVEVASDGAEAIDLYKKAMVSGKPFDAVILDLTIHGAMGGKEAVKKLLKIDPDVKAVVSSGYADDPAISNFKEYGFVDSISKPYKFKELIEVLNKVMRIEFD